MCAQRHEFWLDIDADYILGIDNDVWVYEDFEFPKVEELGLCINLVTRESKARSHTHYIRKSCHGDSYYPQGGVQIISRNANKHYNEWIINSIKGNNWPILWDGNEQSLIYEYTRQFPEKITWLDYRYNCIPSRHAEEEIKNSYLVHFCGPDKTAVFKKLPKDMQEKFYEKK